MKCLDSIIMDCAGLKYQIIVVDNGSSDGSITAVREGYPDVELIELNVNLGFARANNIGISKSQGDIVFIVNSDTQVNTGSIRSIIDFLDAHLEVGILGPRIIGTDGNVQRSTMAFPSLWNSFCRALALDSLCPKLQFFGGYLMRNFDHDKNIFVDIVNGCFWAVRREALQSVGLMDERFFIYGEDMDWCKRFIHTGWKVCFFAGATVVHHGGASSANAPMRFFLEMQKANLQYWKKHHGRSGAFSYVSIQVLHHLLRSVGYGLALASQLGKNPEALFKLRRSLAAIAWYATNGLWYCTVNSQEKG